MKNDRYEAMLTPFAEGMDTRTPWSDYPRPSLVRESYLTLNGAWDFAVTPEDTVSEYGEKILVPFPPESRLSGYNDTVPTGCAMYYRRYFTLPEAFNVGRVLLHFGAVDTLCSVSINGKLVGEHEGGYLPFCFDITDALSDGENELVVKAHDELSHIYPYGKQKRNRGGMWYTPVSGIWQSVWLESVPTEYVESLKITPTLTSVKIEVKGGAEHKRLTLEESGIFYEWQGACIEIQLDEPKLWSPESPYLYRFTLECGEDTVRSYFALRTVSVGETRGVQRLKLNGEPYFFSGLLDQGYYPDGIFLPATPEGYREDILLAKRLGFNMLRKHIKVEPEIFYYLCDLLGIAVFQDMVNNSDYSFILDTALPTVGFTKLPDKLRHRNKRSREIFINHSIDTLDLLYSHPSIVYYTIFNEGWGQFNADEVYEIIKSHDSTRIIDSTSGWFTQKKSDVDSRHVYFKSVKLKGDSGLPVVISEFGGYSLRVSGHLFGDNNYGYRSFSDSESLTAALEKLYLGEILPIIPSGVSALVYTQISDVEDETNGLVTYDRRVVKVDEEKMRAIMSRLYEDFKECTSRDE